VLAPDELLAGFHIPGTWRHAGGHYIKHTWRNALDIQMVGAAVTLTIDPQTRICRDARIALGTAAPTPMRVHTAEDALVGQPVDERLAYVVGDLAVIEARPRTSNRATSEYRRAMIPVLVRRAIIEAMRYAEAR
jgi:CO/xanthine dehydrogenase FAD-binding subunit